MRKILLFFVLMISACATIPISSERANIVPPERIFNHEILSSDEQRNIKVVLTRDKGLVGSAVYMLFKINGKDIAKFRPGETLTIFLENGDYLFGVIPSPNLFGTHTLEETDASIKANRSNNFRILTSADMVAKIKRSSFE